MKNDDDQDGPRIAYGPGRRTKIEGFQSRGRRKVGFTPPAGKLKEVGLNGCFEEEFAEVAHLSPEAGGIFLNRNGISIKQLSAVVKRFFGSPKNIFPNKIFISSQNIEKQY